MAGMKKVLGLLFLGISVYLYVPHQVQGQAFEDVPENFWAYQEIEWGASKGYIKGNNGKFKPNDYLTEAQFVSILIQYFEQKDIEPVTNKHWAENHYKRLGEYNLPLKGYSNDDVKNGKVTRGTVAKVLASALSGEILTEKQSVQFMFDNGISTGRNGVKTLESYGPDEFFTRAQASTIFKRMADGQLVDLKKAIEKEKTKQEIVNMFNATKATFVGNPFQQRPSSLDSYKAGTLHAGYIQDGVNAINFARYLADLEPVIATDELNSLAQYGAVLMAANKDVAHSLPKPQGMSNEFYQKGQESLSTANILSFYLDNEMARSVTRNDQNSFVHAVDRWIGDRDKANYQNLGHRKWILYPHLKTVGLGMAYDEDESGYAALQVTHDYNSADFEMDYVAFPNKGYFPSEYSRLNQAWSLSLNPNVFLAPDSKDVRVTVTRKSDMAKWELTKDDQSYNGTGEFLAVDNSTAFGAYGISFYPGKHNRPFDGSYEIQVTGLKDVYGNEKPITYNIDFFSLMEELKGNSSEQIVDSSSFAKQGNVVYFVKSGGIYESDESGKVNLLVPVEQDTVTGIAVTNNNLFYHVYRESGIIELYKMELLTKKVEKVPYHSFTASEDFAVSQNYVYSEGLRLLHDGSLFNNYMPEEYYYQAYDKNETEQIFLQKGYEDPVQLTFDKTLSKYLPEKHGDWLYYVKNYAGGAKSDLVRLNLTNGTSEDLTKDLELYTYKIIDQKIYYLNYYQLYRMNLDGTNVEQLGDFGIDDFAIFDNQLYIVKGNTYYDYSLDRYVRNTEVYYGDLEGNNFTKL